MTYPDYLARAELYLGSDHHTAITQGARSFATAAQAIRFAFEEAAPVSLRGAMLEIEGTTFAGDLEWDSLTVMDFVAAIEDEFDIIITMNMQAEIETVGQLVDAVQKLKAA